MKSLAASICRLLIVSLLFLPFQSMAGMIGTDRAAGVASAQADRAQIQSAVARADVAKQLEALGVDMNTVQARVAALTDDEARALAGKLDSLPAGAKSNSGWWIAAVVIVAIVIWYAWR